MIQGLAGPDGSTSLGPIPLPHELEPESGALTAQRLGSYFRNHVGAVTDGYRINRIKRTKSKKEPPRWKVESIG